MRFFILLALLLSACATPTLRQDDIPATANLSAEPPNAWRFSGRFGANNNEDDSWSGGLQWRQQGDDYRIQLSGPLGQGGIELSGDASYSQLRVSDDEIYTDGNAERLLWRHTGWRIPFPGMRYWLMGEPAPFYRQGSAERDDSGRLVKLNQAGWTIEIKRYTQVGQHVLPRKIFLHHPEFEVRLVVDQWELANS